MTSTEALAAELEATRSSARRRLLRDTLLDRAPRLTAAERATVARALEAAGLATVLPAPALAPGETWLLTHRAGRGGSVHRVRVARGGVATGVALDRVEIERAYRGLLAATGRAMRRVPHAVAPTLRADLGPDEVGVEGSSLGLSAAVAALSALIGRPPAPTCSGSAQVLEDGRLRPVAFLREKVAALRAELPNVTTLVVAEGQDVDADAIANLEVVRAARLDEALAAFGLDLARLDGFDHDAHARRIDDAKHVHQAASPDDWLLRADELLESASAVEGLDPGRAIRARVTAAHFALHGGRGDVASSRVRELRGRLDEAPPEVAAMAEIVHASALIDAEDFAEALAVSRRAVAACEALGAYDRRQLRGMALGTEGRALLHAGDRAGAEPLLRDALRHHQQHVPMEAPRSSCYLATCLRLLGRPDDALAVIDEALDRMDAHGARPRLFDTTEAYARLERARTLMALGRLDEARADLVRVMDAQESDLAYPRLGALRELACVDLMRGDTVRGDEELARCVRVVETASDPIDRQIAAVAAGRALVEGWTTSVPPSELEAAWGRAFGEVGEVEAMRGRMGRVVY